MQGSGSPPQAGRAHTRTHMLTYTGEKAHALAHLPVYVLRNRSVSRHTFTHTHTHTHTQRLNRLTAHGHPIQAGEQGPSVLPQPGTQTHRHSPCPKRDTQSLQGLRTKRLSDAFSHPTHSLFQRPATGKRYHAECRSRKAVPALKEGQCWF